MLQQGRWKRLCPRQRENDYVATARSPHSVAGPVIAIIFFLLCRAVEQLGYAYVALFESASRFE